MCVISMLGCRARRLSLAVASSAAHPAWIALYHDWAIAGSFALKNADCFLSADTTSKYLHTKRHESMKGIKTLFDMKCGGGLSKKTEKQVVLFTIKNEQCITSKL